MSKLDDLINEFCPNGVKFKTLQNTVGVNRGKRLTKKELTNNAEYEVYHGSKETILGKYHNSNAPAGTTIIVNTGGIGGVKYLDEPFWCSDGSFYLGQTESVNNKFLYYALSGYEDYFYSQKRVGGVPTIDRSVVENFQIPIPPLPVQKEIVRILDKFTDRTTRLVELLNKELTARKKQYGYYRDFLLSEEQLGDEVKWVKLGDVCDVRDGTHASPKKTLSGKLLITSKNVKKSTIDFSGAYFISDKDYQQINERSKVDVWDVLFTMIGTIGEIALVTSPPNYAIKNMGLIKTNDELLSRFLRHYLASEKARNYIKKNKSKGSQEFLALGKLREFPVPVISKNKMSSVVKILDKFDSLVNDLSKGLPAEIEARKKQYEYYRDKLLSFKQTEE